MVLMSIQLFIVCAYIVLLFAISLFAKKRADKGASEYLFAGRKLGRGLIVVNLMLAWQKMPSALVWQLAGIMQPGLQVP